MSGAQALPQAIGSHTQHLVRTEGGLHLGLLSLPHIPLTLSPRLEGPHPRATWVFWKVPLRFYLWPCPISE